MRNEKSAKGVSGFLRQALELVRSIRFPLNLIAFALVLCTAIITYTTATGDTTTEQENFKFAIHTFLAVIGAFFVTSWFCPKSLYYPEDLIKLKEAGIEIRHEPEKAVKVLFISVVIYMTYQILRPILTV